MVAGASSSSMPSSPTASRTHILQTSGMKSLVFEYSPVVSAAGLVEAPLVHAHFDRPGDHVDEGCAISTLLVHLDPLFTEVAHYFSDGEIHIHGAEAEGRSVYDPYLPLVGQGEEGSRARRIDFGGSSSSEPPRHSER